MAMESSRDDKGTRAVMVAVARSMTKRVLSTGWTRVTDETTAVLVWLLIARGCTLRIRFLVSMAL